MPTVFLQISPTPAHVRTARLVAAAVARRTGVAEVLLDEIRLAVGEACSRAVELHRRYAPERLVTIELSDEDRFVVRVRDEVAADMAVGGSPVGDSAHNSADGRADDHADDHANDSVELVADGADQLVGDFGSGAFGLAVIDGLVDDVEIRAVGQGSGTEVCMAWPIGGHIPNQGVP